jgi:hypothetical protein
MTWRVTYTRPWTWATPNRVKKLNTKLNKEAKSKDYRRNALEPDETDGGAWWMTWRNPVHFD